MVRLLAEAAAEKPNRSAKSVALAVFFVMAFISVDWFWCMTNYR